MKKYFIFVPGCQMNRSDAERVNAILSGFGLKPSLEKEADLIVAVACSVRQSAVDRIYGLSRKWKKRKVKTILTGCVLPPDRKKLEKSFDHILKIEEIGKLGKLLGLNKGIVHGPHSDFKPNSSFSALVPIMTGCNNFCSYCVVPYVRGREVSRKAGEIVRECRELIKKGCKEIILLGQNVNSFLSGSLDFPDLLKKVDGIEGDFWIRFATSHPKDFSSKLINVIAKG
ncbi:MAG: radical SAM protein, partial [Patescibacteria group bacterium]